MALAKDRITRSLSAGSMAGSATIPALPPPWRNPAAAFLKVIARASRATSWTVTSGAIRTPPMAGPAATLSTTTKPSSPTPGSRTSTTCAGPRSSANTRHSLSIMPPLASAVCPTRRSSPPASACSRSRRHVQGRRSLHGRPPRRRLRACTRRNGAVPLAVDHAKKGPLPQPSTTLSG